MPQGLVGRTSVASPGGRDGDHVDPDFVEDDDDDRVVDHCLVLG